MRLTASQLRKMIQSEAAAMNEAPKAPAAPRRAKAADPMTAAIDTLIDLVFDDYEDQGFDRATLDDYRASIADEVKTSLVQAVEDAANSG